jgi:hypothetical protein
MRLVKKRLLRNFASILPSTSTDRFPIFHCSVANSNLKCNRSVFSQIMFTLINTWFQPGVAAQAEVGNHLNGFRISCAFRFTWLKPGVNESSFRNHHWMHQPGPARLRFAGPLLNHNPAPGDAANRAQSPNQPDRSASRSEQKWETGRALHLPKL